jgi:hypothetical protein
VAYSPSQVYAALVRAGVPSGDAGTMTQISGAESGYGANVVSGMNKNGTVDYGVFQINNGAWPQFGGSKVATMSLDDQAAAAAVVYNKQGLGAWSTYNSGAYKGYSSGTGAGSAIAQGPTDASSGVAAGSTGAHSSTSSSDSSGSAQQATGMPIQVGLQPEEVSAIQKWVDSFQTATGKAFAGAVQAAWTSIDSLFKGVENWFLRGGLILIGIVLLIVGLFALFWTEGGSASIPRLASRAA